MLAVAGAGVVAGAVNAIVGSGSLVTFPTLLAVGYSPVVANVSNTVGLVFGGISGAWGYRRELRGQRARVLQLAGGSAIGALRGRHPLLELPSSVFDAVVPILILLSVALMAFKPTPRAAERDHLIPATGGTFLTGIYGGYFGAAQGVILLALLRSGVRRRPPAPQRGQERAGRGGQRRRGRPLHRGRRRRVGGRGPDRRRLDRRGAVGARYGRRLPEVWLRRIVIVGGTIVAVILIVD